MENFNVCYVIFRLDPRDVALSNMYTAYRYFLEFVDWFETEEEALKHILTLNIYDKYTIIKEYRRKI
jgi:hypothetical protein